MNLYFLYTKSKEHGECTNVITIYLYIINKNIYISYSIPHRKV